MACAGLMMGVLIYFACEVSGMTACSDLFLEVGFMYHNLLARHSKQSFTLATDPYVVLKSSCRFPERVAHSGHDPMDPHTNPFWPYVVFDAAINTRKMPDPMLL